MAGDETEKLEVPVAEEYNCPYQDAKDETQPCPFKSKSDIMIGAHKRAIHIKRDVKKVEVKDEGSKEDAKKSKRIETKFTKFTENESHDEFRRKMGKFESYKVRCNIKGEEVADGLYRFCETPLKRKLITSSKVAKDIKSTDPEVMKKEIERLCMPKVNFYVEREQFHKLEQGEDKTIKNFESRV